LKIRLFCKSQLELSQAIKNLIDSYWENKIDETSLIEHVHKAIVINEDKAFKDGQYTKVLQ
jgi:uncharacterized protein (TIGR04540 family)